MEIEGMNKVEANISVTIEAANPKNQDFDRAVYRSQNCS